jgi:hypothetical protein
LNQLRACFRAGNCSECHDESETKIDIPQCAVPFRCHHRFSDDVRKVSTDGEIPIQTDETQGRTGDKAPAHSKKPAEDANEEPNDDQIDRTDVRP